MPAAVNKPVEETHPPLKATRELSRLVEAIHKYWMLVEQAEPKLKSARQILAAKLVELGATAVKHKLGTLELRTMERAEVDHDALLNELVDRHLVPREVITSLQEKHTKTTTTAPFVVVPRSWGEQAKKAA